MELTQLRYFIKVAELEHITQAAEELHIAQPALTQTIHRLENELEVPLFTNKGRNIVLTEYGRYFYESLTPLLNKILELPNQLREFSKYENTTVHLNVLAASNLVTQAIIEYQKIDDSLKIKLFQNDDNDLCDICVTTRLFYQEPKLKNWQKFICTENIYLAVPNNEKYKDKKSITLNEIKDEQFISLSGAKQFRAICDKYCKSAGIKPNIIFESDSPQAVRNMIAANIGIGFWPQISWELIESNNVKLLPIVDPKCSRDILISYSKNKSDNSKIENFYTFLTDFFEKKIKNAEKLI